MLFYQLINLLSHLKNELNSWYSDEVKAAIDNGMSKKDGSTKSISLAMGGVEPFATKLSIKAWRDLPNPSFPTVGFQEAGLLIAHA